jgi:hypothetical protein
MVCAGQGDALGIVFKCAPWGDAHPRDASGALGGGLGGVRLKNGNGVIMRLESRIAGAGLNLGSVSGITVTMD